MERWLIRMTLMTALLLAYLSHQPLESTSGFPVLLQENDTLFDSNSSESMIDLKSVKLIFCGANVGTAVVIDDRTLLTANHVTEGNLACIDDITGDVGSVDLRDTENDISTIKFARKTFSDDHKFKISCKGFKKNNIYYAVGWERGTDLVVNRLKATGSFRTINAEHSRFEHVSVLIGRMVKGMSGGPVIDKNGKMVGMNTATDSIARPPSQRRCAILHFVIQRREQRSKLPSHHDHRHTAHQEKSGAQSVVQHPKLQLRG